MGIGINFDKDDDFDGPLFGRHWLEDLSPINNDKLYTKEQVWEAFQNLNVSGQNWVFSKIKEK